jgi:hypothetical protein
MPVVIPATIHVVTTSETDWPAIIAAFVSGLAAIATVVAAIIGIRGTAREAQRGRATASADLKASLATATENLRLGISADDHRARIAEKRRIYAAYVHAITRFVAEIFKMEGLLTGVRLADSPRDRRAALDAASGAMGLALGELMLMATGEVQSLAQEASNWSYGLLDRPPDRTNPPSPVVGFPPDSAFTFLINKLIDAMRLDLGETVSTASAVPSSFISDAGVQSSGMNEGDHLAGSR